MDGLCAAYVEDLKKIADNIVSERFRLLSDTIQSWPPFSDQSESDNEETIRSLVYEKSIHMILENPGAQRLSEIQRDILRAYMKEGIDVALQELKKKTRFAS